MSQRIKGITVEIGGDVTGLNKALESTEKKISGTQKQLRDVERLLKLDPTNTELLAQRQRLLAQSTEAAKEKLEKLRSAEKQVQEQFKQGKASQEQLDALRREIIQTELSLNKLENSADDAENSLYNAGKTGKESGAEIESGMSGAGKVVAGVAAGITAAFAAATAGAIAAGKALIDFTVNGAAYADEVLTTSTQTGIATDKLQEYMYAAELVDVSTETLTKSMAKQIKSMKAVQDGTALSVEAYDKLGVQVLNADGSLRDSDTVYWETIDALGKMENETERDALAMQILGKSAQELNPLIEAGSQRMNELGREAQNAGYVISDEMLGAYGALDDNIQRLTVTSEGAKNALGTVLLPTLTELSGTGVDLLAQFTSGMNAANGDISAMSDVIGEVLPQALDAILEYVPELLEVIGSVLNAVMDAIVDNLPQILDAGVSIIMSLLDGIVDALPQIVDAALDMILALVKGIIKALPKIIEAGIKAVQALIQGIADALPELIPAIIDGVLLAAQTLIDNLPVLLDAVLQLIRGLVDGLLDALPMIIDALPDLIIGIVKFILDAIPEIIDAVIDIVLAIVDALPEICDALIDAIPEIIDGIITAVIDAVPKIISAIVKAIPKIIGGIIKAVVSLTGKFFEAGKELLEALWEGMKDIWNAVEDWARDAVDEIAEYFSDSADDAEKAGRNISQGMADGIKKNDKKSVNAMEKMCAAISKIVDGTSDAVKTVAEEGYRAASEIAAEYAREAEERAQDAITSALEAGQAFNDMINETREATAGSKSTFDYVTGLTAELMSLADESGNVEEQDRARAQTILGIVNEALGTEYEMVDGVIQKYDELQSSIADLIQIKRVEALMELNKDDYAQALNDKETATITAADTQDKYNQCLKEYNEVLAEIEEKKAAGKGAEITDYANIVMANKSLSDSKKAYESAVKYLENINSTVSKYEGAMTAVFEKDYAGAEKILTGTTEMVDAKTGEIIGKTKERRDDAVGIGTDLCEGLADGIVAGAYMATDATKDLVEAVLRTARETADSHSPSRKMIALGEDMGEGAEIGIENSAANVAKSGANLATSIMDGFIFNMAAIPAFASYGAIMNAQQPQNVATRTNSVTIGSINLSVDAPNVTDVHDLASLVADQINDSILARQAVYA